MVSCFVFCCFLGGSAASRVEVCFGPFIASVHVCQCRCNTSASDMLMYKVGWELILGRSRVGIWSI